MTGIIPIDKHQDITSFGIIAKMRGITKEKKAGHAGTLDPMATGVLPVLFGGATRFLDLLPDHTKGYRATFRLGTTTDTLDVTGTVLTESEVTANAKDVELILPQFCGKIQQIPPMFSAITKDGVRLYELARQGVEIPRESREITVEKIELIDCNESLNEYTIDVVCSKGTYIRTICDDIGRLLGCGAVMNGLRRTLAAGFTLDDCITIDEAQRLKDSGEGFESCIFSIEKVFSVYPMVVVSPAQSNRFANGGYLDLERIPGKISDGICRVYSADKLFLGLGEWCSVQGQLKVKKLIVRRD